MTFINKKSRLFMNRSDKKPERRRSEARLKSYPSAIDIRAWCDVVEDRRQHILELVTKGTDKCFGKLIPVEAIINALVAEKLADIKKLKESNAQLMGFIESVNLSEGDKEKLFSLKRAMHPIGVGHESKAEECVAAKRHERETSEVNALLNDQALGSYKVTTTGPARVITRIKGFRQPKGASTPVQSAAGTVATVWSPSQQRATPAPPGTISGFDQTTPRTLSAGAGASQQRAAVPGSAATAGGFEQTALETPSAGVGVSSVWSQQYAGSPAYAGPVRSFEPKAPSTISAGASPMWIPTQQGVASPGSAEVFSGFEQTTPRTASAGAGPSTVWSPSQQRAVSPRSAEGVSGFEQSTSRTPLAGPGASNQGIPSQALNYIHQESPAVSGIYDTSMLETTREKQLAGIVTPSQRSMPITQIPSQAIGSGQTAALGDFGVPEQASFSQQQSTKSFRKPGDSPSQVRFLEDLPSGQLTRDKPSTPRTQAKPSEIEYIEKQLKDGIYDKIGVEETGTGMHSIQVVPVLDYNLPPEEFKAQADSMQAFCQQLQETLQKIQNERDKYKNQLDATLEELADLKKIGSEITSTLCTDEIDTFETKMKQMRTGNLSPEQEADVIKQEVEVLKKYCMKLKSIEDENEKLRHTIKGQGYDGEKAAKNILNVTDKTLDEVGSERDMLINTIKDLENRLAKYNNLPEDVIMELTGEGSDGQLKDIFKTLQETVKDRDILAAKVQKLEKELQQYRDLTEDLDVYRNRSKMLDNALEERDKMSKKVEQIKGIEDELNQLRKRSSRLNELEEELKLHSKNDKNIGSELKKMTSRCNCLEKDLINGRMEKDSMCTRIEYMKKEIETLRSKCKEAEIHKLERDKLQMKLNQLAPMQAQYEDMRLKCKCLESVAAEKDLYKQKYEEVLAMEGQGNLLRSQVEANKNLEREKNSLIKQVADLECCICEQEDEIKKLVMQIDHLCHTKDTNQCRVKEALASMRAEIERKDCLIAESERKLATVQAQLKSSIQGVSCETICYKTRIEDLERELSQAHLQIETLKKQLNITDGSLRDLGKVTKDECQTVARMKCELQAAKSENKKLRDIAGRMIAITGDEHVQNMLMQSQCAVRRVVEELSRQYKEWDQMKGCQKKGHMVKDCPCKGTNVDTNQLSESENERLVEDLKDIQREKAKLEKLVKKIQTDKSSDGAQNELIEL